MNTDHIYSYETEQSARNACSRMNKEWGKKVFIALEERDGWIVIHINKLMQSNLLNKIINKYKEEK